VGHALSPGLSQYTAAQPHAAELYYTCLACGHSQSMLVEQEILEDHKEGQSTKPDVLKSL